jgi:uncharacterized membrane protein
MPSQKPSNRIVFLDWLRGLAAVTMLQGHTFDSFLRPESRDGAAFVYSQFFGGQAPAVFLFLTGITYALGMNRCQEQPPWQRVLSALKRARYLFLLAILFRVQMWVFAWPGSAWTDMLKVDILNAMGATAALLAVVALARGMSRVKVALAAGIALAALAPVISILDTSAIPVAIRAYFVPSYEYFSIFPWGAFLAFGVAVGSMIPMIQQSDWSRVMQWAALAGFGLVLGGQYFSSLPYSFYSKSEFWLNSPALIACKMGVTLLLAAGAFLWTGYLSAGWSWVRQLGTTSLAVYWVHIELVYGRWFAYYRSRLTVWECLIAAVVLTVAMIGISLGVSRVPWKQVKRALVPKRAKPAIPEPAYAYRSFVARR